jgi:hypothetical protein
LNHSNFLISDRGHQYFLWNVLAQQTVEFLIAAPFPAGKWAGLIGRALMLLIDGIPCNLFAVVKGYRLNLTAIGLSLSTMAELININILLSTISMNVIPALALDHRHDSTFVVGANHSIALPLTHLTSCFNVQGPRAQRLSVGDLP